MVRRVVLAIVMAAWGLASASAQSTQQVLEQAGLIGGWQIDCTRPTSDKNIRTSYAISPTGEAQLVYDSGPGSTPWVIRILSAKRTAPDRVSYLSESVADNKRLDVILLIQDGRIRVWSSRRPDGQYLVDNGKLTANGRASPLQSRCK